MKRSTKYGLVIATIITAMMGSIGVKAITLDESIDFKTEELYCLAQNIYFEARGESRLGQMAVAWVTLNRVEDKNYPDTICDVVWEKNQFSWTNDGKSDKPVDMMAWAEALSIAWEVYTIHDSQVDPTDGSIMFHTVNKKPYWKKEYLVTSRIDNHIFYKVRS